MEPEEERGIMGFELALRPQPKGPLSSTIRRPAVKISHSQSLIMRPQSQHFYYAFLHQYLIHQTMLDIDPA